VGGEPRRDLYHFGSARFHGIGVELEGLGEPPRESEAGFAPQDTEEIAMVVVEVMIWKSGVLHRQTTTHLLGAREGTMRSP